MIKYCQGDPRAIAAVESWKFNHPVTLMSKEAIEEYEERTRTTYSFPRSEGEDPCAD